EIQRMHQELCAMHAAQALLRLAVDELVIRARRFPREAADEADGFHFVIQQCTWRKFTQNCHPGSRVKRGYPGPTENMSPWVPARAMQPHRLAGMTIFFLVLIFQRKERGEQCCALRIGNAVDA